VADVDSSTLKVQTAKKYLGDERFKLKLYDLVACEVRDILFQTGRLSYETSWSLKEFEDFQLPTSSSRFRNPRSIRKRFSQQGVDFFLKLTEAFDPALALLSHLLTNGPRRPLTFNETRPSIVRAVQLW
jgi:hypothetical protein